MNRTKEQFEKNYDEKITRILQKVETLLHHLNERPHTLYEISTLLDYPIEVTRPLIETYIDLGIVRKLSGYPDLYLVPDNKIESTITGVRKHVREEFGVRMKEVSEFE